MKYRSKFFNGLSDEDKKLLNNVIHSPRLVDQINKMNEDYADGPDAWPEDDELYKIAFTSMEIEAMDQIVGMKEGAIKQQKKDTGLATHYTVSVSAVQYTKIKAKSNDCGIPITKLMNLLIDNYMDRVKINIECP